MQKRITTEEMHAAARQLAKSERGCAAMRRLLPLLQHEDLELDLLDQRAFMALLGGVWTQRAGEVDQIIRQTLAEKSGGG